MLVIRLQIFICCIVVEEFMLHSFPLYRQYFMSYVEFVVEEFMFPAPGVQNPGGYFKVASLAARPMEASQWPELLRGT